jgi:cell wall assembly regulator SMI1
LRNAINEDVISGALKNLPLYLFGEFIRGVRTCDCELYDEWLRTHRDDLVNQLRRGAAIANLDETDEALVAHFAIDLDRQASTLRSRGEASGSAKATIHDLTIERVELLSNLFSGKTRYGAVGYGHRMSLVTQLWDEAEKPGVLAENLHAKWPPRFNALARGHVELRFRPQKWTDYFALVQSLREKVLASFEEL